MRLEKPGFGAYVGIAMAPHDADDGSEDCCMIPDGELDPKLVEEARRCQREYGLLAELKETRTTEREYPLSAEERRSPRGTRRNSPCPCGSGRKWKKCCGQSKA